MSFMKSGYPLARQWAPIVHPPKIVSFDRKYRQVKITILLDFSLTVTVESILPKVDVVRRRMSTIELKFRFPSVGELSRN